MDEYGKALAEMAAEPLEEYEPVGNGWGGSRRGAGMAGRKNPNAGRKTINPAGHTVARNVTFDPDIFQRVLWHAEEHGITFSAAVNMLLSEVLKEKCI